MDDPPFYVRITDYHYVTSGAYDGRIVYNFESVERNSITGEWLSDGYRRGDYSPPDSTEGEGLSCPLLETNDVLVPIDTIALVHQINTRGTVGYEFTSPDLGPLTTENSEEVIGTLYTTTPTTKITAVRSYGVEFWKAVPDIETSTETFLRGIPAAINQWGILTTNYQQLYGRKDIGMGDDGSTASIFVTQTSTASLTSSPTVGYSVAHTNTYLSRTGGWNISCVPMGITGMVGITGIVAPQVGTAFRSTNQIPNNSGDGQGGVCYLVNGYMQADVTTPSFFSAGGPFIGQGGDGAFAVFRTDGGTGNRIIRQGIDKVIQPGQSIRVAGGIIYSATGLSNFTGPPGVSGVTGVAGSQGVTGIQGATGLQGTAGSTGAQGIQGVTGLQGPTGIQGVTGTFGGTMTTPLTISPIGSNPQRGIAFDATGISGSDRIVSFDMLNPAGSGGGINFNVNGSLVLQLLANLAVSANSFTTFGGGTRIGDHYIQRGGGQKWALGTAGTDDSHYMDGVNNTSLQLLASWKSSTTNSREGFRLSGTWADNTDATRKARCITYIFDTAAREVSRDESDGSRGYRVQTVHTTAPADSMLPNGSVCFYDDGSGSLAIKLKDSGGTVRTGTVTLT